MSDTKPEIWTPPAIVEHHHSGPCKCEPTLAYIRVSRVGDRQILVSPDIQLDSCKADARRKNKRIVDVIPDIDKSGRTFTKRSVDRAIAMIEASKAKSITVWKWSRWGRNLELSLAYLARTESVGGRVDAATEDIDQSTATGRLHRDLTMRFDQFQSEQIGETWRAVHERRRAHGLPINGRARFGYVYISEKAIKEAQKRKEDPHKDSEKCGPCREQWSHYIKHEAEGPALKECYKLFIGGAGFITLADDLNQRGFRTTQGELWTPQGLSLMMDTGFAAGWLRERSEEQKAKLRVTKKQLRNSLKNFDVWRLGAQPAIIDEDVWKAYLKLREKQADLPPRWHTTVHALSALMFCQVCARRLSTKYPGSSRQHSWVCTWRKTHHPDTHVSVSNRAALEIVRSWVLTNAEPLRGEHTVDDLAKAALAGPRPARTSRQVQAEIDGEMRALDKLILMNARGKINDDQFNLASAEIEETLAPLRVELAALTAKPDPDGRPSYEAFRSLAEVWDETLAVDPGRLNVPLGRVISYVIVSPARGRPARSGVPRTGWVDVSDRVEVVGRWEASSRDRWLAARRRKFPA